MFGLRVISSNIKKQSNIQYHLSNATVDLDSYKTSYREYKESNRDAADLMAVMWDIIDLIHVDVSEPKRNRRFDKVDRITNYR